MDTKLKVVRQSDFDRFVFLTYSGSKIVGLNYHQGDEMMMDWVKPCPALTDIFERYSEKNSGLNWDERVNKAIELYEYAFLFQGGNDKPKTTLRRSLVDTLFNLLREDFDSSELVYYTDEELVQRINTEINNK